MSQGTRRGASGGTASWVKLLILTTTLVGCFISHVQANSGSGDDIYSRGSLSTVEASTVDASTVDSVTLGGQRIKPTALANFQPARASHETRSSNEYPINRANIDRRHQEELPSTDCFAKRNEILKRQTAGSSSGTRPPSFQTGYQSLKPKQESPASHFNESSLNLNEHVPDCNETGAYEPVQCHPKIGYCWCVNKYGNAIKNSATLLSQKPYCDQTMYDSESTHVLVVTGTTTERLKKYFKKTSSFPETTTPNGNINFEAESPQLVGPREPGAKHEEPILPLIPEDCKNSQAIAKERASKRINDSIWVPACDIDNDRLYALRQCHKSKVCWCVDQVTGMPLITKELISDNPSTNCTEIKRIVELASNVMTSSAGKSSQPAFYHGSSEFCDNYRRIEFVVSLNNQFRQQIGDYIRQTSPSLLPPELLTINPNNMAETEVSRWKFRLMDRDHDGKLGDREWSKFKNNFKLVDKNDEIELAALKERSSYSNMGPLMILRSERKCWRDFLDFCGSGDLLNNESVSSSKWLRCTEMPPKADKGSSEERVLTLAFSKNTYANSREAAIMRSKKKNPFTNILKPD